MIVSCHHPAWGRFEFQFSDQRVLVAGGRPVFAFIPWLENGARNETAQAQYVVAEIKATCILAKNIQKPLQKAK